MHAATNTTHIVKERKGYGPYHRLSLRGLSRVGSEKAQTAAPQHTYQVSFQAHLLVETNPVGAAERVTRRIHFPEKLRRKRTTKRSPSTFWNSRLWLHDLNNMDADSGALFAVSEAPWVFEIRMNAVEQKEEKNRRPIKCELETRVLSCLS